MAYLRRAVEIDPASPFAYAALALGYGITRTRQASRGVCTVQSRRAAVAGFGGLAVIYTALGERDDAFRWLESARKARFSWMPWTADFSRQDPDLFTPLRSDPRIAEIIQRIGIPVLKQSKSGVGRGSIALR